MATWTYYGRGAATPISMPSGFMVLKRHIDIPDIIANPQKLALAASPTVRLETFASTGFGAADILELWEVPAGFMLLQVGVRVTTVEGGACTADIGNATDSQTHLAAADAVGYMGTIDLNSATTQITLVADTHAGYTNYQGVVFVTAGSIDLTFVTAATAVAVFDVWAVGCKVF